MQEDVFDGSNELAPASIGRRKFVFATLSAASLAFVDLWADVHAYAADNTGANAFMQVSGLVSQDASNAVTGAAFYQALKRDDRNFDANVAELAKQIAANPDITIESLADKLDRNKQTALRDTLNRIVSAWYLGVVGFRTYAYESALMYGVVSDVLSPPSYVRRGPLYWAHSHQLPSA